MDTTQSTTAPIRVGIIGATGYVGGELIRLLSAHPAIKVVGLTGRERQGDHVGIVHPHLATTAHTLASELDGDVDAVFLALPHGTAAERAPALLEQGITVIDQGPDFRLSNAADYPDWYGFEHPHPELLGRAIYGLPELHRADLLAAGVARAAGTPALVGSPGCYPTATILALAPLARAGLIADVVVDAKSGVSGAGRGAKAEMGFAEVNESVRAYGVPTHRHTPEIAQGLADLGARSPRLTFAPHLVPMTRGLIATCYATLRPNVTAGEVAEAYAHEYAEEPFVRVTASFPPTKATLGSNWCLVHATVDEANHRLVAVGVLDNLVKGAAGSAIQNMNAALGLPETLGLEALPLWP